MFYKLYTKSYDKLHELPAYVELIDNTVKDTKGEKILEAGVGTGNTLPFLRNKVVYGIDLDEERLKKARLKRGKNHIIKKADVQNLPFKKNFFDTVICVNTLNFVENDNIALEEFSRVLKKGGRLIVHVPRKDSKFLEMFKKSIKSIGILSTIKLLPWVIAISIANAQIYKTMRKYTVSGLKKKIHEKGFSIEKINPRSYLGQGIYCVAKKN